MSFLFLIRYILGKGVSDDLGGREVKIVQDVHTLIKKTKAKEFFPGWVSKLTKKGVKKVVKTGRNLALFHVESGRILALFCLKSGKGPEKHLATLAP